MAGHSCVTTDLRVVVTLQTDVVLLHAPAVAVLVTQTRRTAVVADVAEVTGAHVRLYTAAVGRAALGTHGRTHGRPETHTGIRTVYDDIESYDVIAQ